MKIVIAIDSFKGSLTSWKPETVQPQESIGYSRRLNASSALWQMEVKEP